MMTDYIEVEHEGETVRQYPNGALRHANGHFVTRYPSDAPIIDSELSVEYNARRWDEERSQAAQEREETQRALARSLVTQVAGAKVPADGMGALGDILVAELAQDTAAKEHGISNYVKVMKEYGRMAGLIKEKESQQTLNIDKAVILSQDAEAHVAMLLERLQERLVSHAAGDSATVTEGDGPKD